MTNTHEERRLMIVDDDLDLATAYIELMESEGYMACHAVSHADALRIADESGPHLALIDLNLHGENGLDILTALKTEYPDIQTVLMTASADTELLSEALERGAVGCLRKPVDVEELFQFLAEHFKPCGQSSFS